MNARLLHTLGTYTIHTHTRRHAAAAVNRFGFRIPPRLVSLVQACWDDDFERRPDFVAVVEELEAIQRELGDSDGRQAAGGGCCNLQ